MIHTIDDSDWTYEVQSLVACAASGEDAALPAPGFRWRCTRLDPRWSCAAGAYSTASAARDAAVRAILATVLASAYHAVRRAHERAYAYIPVPPGETPQGAFDGGEDGIAEEMALDVAEDIGADPTWLREPLLVVPPEVAPEDLSRRVYAHLLLHQHPQDREHDPMPASD